MGEDRQPTCCPQCHTCWEDSAIWSLLGASLLDGAREEPAGGRPAWTCSPVQRGNAHEPRALLTLLSPGVQMRVTSLKKKKLVWVLKTQFFFFLINCNERVPTGDVVLHTSLHSWDIGLAPCFLFFFCCSVFSFVFFFSKHSLPNASPRVLGECWLGPSIVTVDLGSKVTLL